MYPISPIFADYLKRHDKQYIVKAIIDGQEYTSANIVDFTIENILAAADEFEIGTAIPSKLTMKLRLPEAIRPNAQVKPYIALSLESMSWLDAEYPWLEMHIPWEAGATEWLPLGEFYIDSREKINEVWTYVCYDKLITADVAYISQLSYPATQKAVFDEICTRLGFSYDGSVVINPSYRIQAGPAGYSCRQVLAYIAGANGASIYMGKDGVIRFKRFAAGAPAVFNLTAADYIRAKQVNPVKTFTRIEVMYNTEDQLTYEAGTGDENHTLYLENPFMTQAQVNDLLAALNGLSYLPLTMDSRGFPHLDQGDVIGFEQHESRSWIETITSWQDTDIPWDGIQRYTTCILRQTLTFKGGLKHKIDAPSTSEQRSEFNLEGSLTQQVNRLNQNTVRYGKPYYGVTHSRTEGIVVEREDHLYKGVLSGEELSFYADGSRALWFDVPSRRFKFNGTLEAVDGIFSGDLQAAGGTFTGTLRGVDGDFSGELRAARGTFQGDLQAAGGTFTGTLVGVDGTFSGTITAASIIGGTINGSTIIGATIKTATSGERIELSPSGFVFYDSYNARRVTLGTNQEANISGHTYYNSSGISMGLIYANPDELHVMGNRSLRLGSNGGTITLQGPVHFTRGSEVTGLNLVIGQVSGLQSELNYLQSQINSLRYTYNSHTHSVTIPNHNHGNYQNQNWGGTFTTSAP
ncbi:hypothetical protein J6TS7_31030 [Paenibacillus dendritiformis]|uniref:DUF3672 domain-containing protein n=1 Tax=Paenibacillus TaxID=44249 RepID=UPI001B2C8381|nr:DUF3672 domain-containing protein [Paenibacillus dendritiformis]MEB9893810.1 DUF3672 domain-containing protein [Bacillus cereus]GIO79493.1 hypothetical protein J6TS7_31030 [Paenibacillus dendritiformis]